MLDEFLQRYRDKFGEAFPLMCCMGMTDSEIADVIGSCIRSEQPFKPIEGVDY